MSKGNNDNQLSDMDIINLIEKRVQHRLFREYEAADEIKLILEAQSIEILDLPFKTGGKSTWRRLQMAEPPGDDETVGVMQLAREAILACGDEPKLSVLVSSAKRQLARLLKKGEGFEFLSGKELSFSDREMQGRKFADCAFSFALAGVTDPQLFRLLEEGAEAELRYCIRAPVAFWLKHKILAGALGRRRLVVW